MGWRPMMAGARCSSIIFAMASSLPVQVASPQPYRPGSLVSILTSTKFSLRDWGGLVRRTLTLVIVRLRGALASARGQASGAAAKAAERRKERRDFMVEVMREISKV